MEIIFIKTFSLGAIIISVLILSFLISFITNSTNFYSDLLKRRGIHLIFVFSLVAMVGSLLMALFFDFPPCDLCWYQRMFMYPIVFISAFSLYKKDYKNGATYSLMLAIIGAFIALYHYLLQISDYLKNSLALCSPFSVADCSLPDFIEYGCVTTPYIYVMAFLLIIISAYYASRNN